MSDLSATESLSLRGALSAENATRVKQAAASSGLPRAPIAAKARPRHLDAQLVTTETYVALEAEVRALTARSAEANMFVEPAWVHARAVAEGGEALIQVAVVFDVDEAGRHLVGALPVRLERVQPWRPFRQVTAGLHADMSLTIPLLDRDVVPIALDALLHVLAAAPHRPRFLRLPCLAEGGVVARAVHALPAKRRPLEVIVRRSRPWLDRAFRPVCRATLPALDPYAVRFTRHDGDEARFALEEFFALEAASWKGREGQAIICDPADAGVLRFAVARLAAEGRAELVALRLDGCPAAMALLFKSRGTVFVHKLAHDEAFAHLSPSRHLAVHLTDALLAEPGFVLADSCAPPQGRALSDLWLRHRDVSDVLIDLGSQASDGLAAAVMIERLLQSGRSYLNRRRAGAGG